MLLFLIMNLMIKYFPRFLLSEKKMNIPIELQMFWCHLEELIELNQRELKQMEPILNFQVPAEGLDLVILLHTQYYSIEVS